MIINREDRALTCVDIDFACCIEALALSSVWQSG